MVLALASASILFRDFLEGLFVVAIGSMLVHAAFRLVTGRTKPYRCPNCHGVTSRGYANCRHCGSPISQ
ncbi:MAG: hypothetical protein HKL83_03760 [Acidimicrobiaceae bacterium]|nr:hypothetical protein [Acidimicrobiaceae bacterium]